MRSAQGWSFAALALITACGSGGSEPPASAPPPTAVPPPIPSGITVTEAAPADAAEFLTRVRAMRNEGIEDYQARCCVGVAPERMAEHAAITTGPLTGTDTQLVTAVGSGRIRFWPTVAAACLSELRRAVPAVHTTCDGPWAHGGPVPELEDIAVCHDALVGTVAEAEPCTANLECANGYCTSLPRPDGSTFEGCRAYAASGEACGGLAGAQCRHPLECIAGHCGARLAAGAACVPSEYWACAVGHFCSAPDGAASGTCTARLANGAACTESRQCASEVCDAGTCAPICMGAPLADVPADGPAEEGAVGTEHSAGGPGEGTIGLGTLGTVGS